MSGLKDILYLLRNYRGKVALNIFYIIIFAFLSVFTFLAVVPFLNILFKRNNEVPALPIRDEVNLGDYLMGTFKHHFGTFLAENGAVTTLLYVCGFIIAVTLVKNTVYYLAQINLGYLRADIIRDLRKELYTKLVTLPLSYFTEERKGDLISRSTNDVHEVEVSTIGVINGLLKAPVLIFFFLGTLFILNWKLTLFALVFLPLSGLVISKVGKLVKKSAKKSKEQLGEVINVMEETLSGNRIIKAFNAQEQFQQKFDVKNNEFTRLMHKVYRKQYLASPFSETLSILVIAVLLYVGGQLVLDETNALDGTFFISYLALFSQIIQPAKELSNAFIMMNKGAASLERIKEITSAEDDLKDAENAKDLIGFSNSIEFKDVCFSYADEQVIHNISFELKKGETIALVGPSGGGKSTLANLLARFYETSNGDILIDGNSIKSLKTESLRNQMGIVSQESILFNDSVKNNVALGHQSIDEKKLANALQISNSEEFVNQLPLQSNETIGEGGNKLSGGQKQRLSIARAVYKNPDILILDEATSALDTESEKLVQDAINNLMENRTSLVIAHRLSTIQKADKILVIKDGRIAEKGTHQELIELNGVYKNLVDLQKV